MDKLFSDFPKPSYEDWVEQLKKDLKGKPETFLQTDDPIEGFSFNAYQHQYSENTRFPEAFHNIHIRTIHRNNNAWENMATIRVDNETHANQQALHLLNIGITSLRFELNNASVEWSKLLDNIQLQYIQTTFRINTTQLYFEVLERFSKQDLQQVFFELDWINVINKEWKTIAHSLNKHPRYTFCANGYAVQQCGSNTWQEVAYSIASAHEYLVQLIHCGLLPDQATRCIHFNLGAGTNYFYEIAKVRALRLLWARIVEEYQPTENTSLYAKINGITGFTNKSLLDPYTNLLRQTTEAMSFILSGVHSVCVQAYDSYSSVGTTKLSSRMAVNIPLILQEESYFDKVIDPLGGSYALEHLTYKIADLAWTEFQHIEALGGVQNQNAIAHITDKICQTARIRQQRIADKTDTLIGINEFPNPTKENNQWIPIDNYLNMPALVLEQTIASVQ